MKRRRKAVPCVMCDSPTFTPSGVYYACQHIHEVGKAEIRRRENLPDDGETALYRVPQEVRVEHWTEKGDAGFSYKEGKELVDLLFLLACSVPFSEHTEMPREKIMYYDRQNTEYRDRAVSLKSGQARALDRIISLLRTLAKSSWLEGRRSGEGFLTKLATGQVSFSELNKL